MTLPLFPTLAGITWPAARKPGFATQIQPSLAGRRTPVRFQLEPRWSYELRVEFLRNFGGRVEFSNLLNLYLNCQGSYGTFYFNDLGDNSVTNQSMGIGDGVTVAFPLVRTFAGFAQRIAALNGAAVVSVGGVPAVGYTISASGVVTFGVAPANGAAITWTGAYYWICRFDDDQLDLSQFMSNWWEVRQLKFSTEIIL